MLLVNIFSIFIQKRLAVTVKGYTFALAFGKQGLVRPRGTGAEERRVHWKSYIKRESSTRAWMVFGEDVVLLRGYPRVKKKRTVIIPVYAGHIRGCEKKRDKRVSPGSPETEQMPFPYGVKAKDILQWRVWSWLRMNASYRLNTCKSRGSMDSASLSLMATGARVSNAYPTCPLLRDSLLKGSLIPDVFVFPHGSDK